MFSDCVFFWLVLWNIITQLFVSHMSAGGSGGAEKIVKMTNRALCFCLFLTENVIMVRESDEAFVEMWVEQRGNVQPTLCSSSITITRLIPYIA